MAIIKWGTTLADLVGVLPVVLESLRTMDIGSRPFVIVDDPVTGRFVQFARVVKRFPGDDAKGIAQLGEMGFDVPALGIVLQGFGNDPREGARCAVATLRKWLPDQATLVVTLDADALN
jgi:hypothetical protein